MYKYEHRMILNAQSFHFHIHADLEIAKYVSSQLHYLSSLGYSSYRYNHRYDDRANQTSGNLNEQIREQLYHTPRLPMLR